MAILQTILDFVIFLVSLSVLVMIHELGHFAAAKVFKVYCMDFSIGFGKAIFHKKRKNGETYFSLRVVPFGGFVAMAEDEGETPEGVVVPKHRSINGIKKWKTAIIMSSGVVMNFLLAIVLIYASCQFFPIDSVFSNAYLVKENSPAALAGVVSYDSEDITKGDILDTVAYYYDENGYIYAKDQEGNLNIKTEAGYELIEDTSAIKITQTESIFAEKAVFTKADSSSEEYYVVFKTAGLSLKELNFKSEYMLFHKSEIVEGKFKYVSGADILGNDVEKLKQYTSLTLHTTFHREDPATSTEKPIVLNIDNGVLDELGLLFYHSQKWSNFGEAWVRTFKNFGNGASMIFTGLGDLFSGKGWENAGGIVAIYSSSTKVLNEIGFGYYLYYWGVISINLGIINLLPFPGLDGWHLLVIAIEGIFRKKLPEKFKTIASYVGIALLFGLMILLLVKDIFFPII